jgi:hypothetical protein
MIDDVRSYISLHDVEDRERIKLTVNDAWAAGAQIQRMFTDIFGALPLKVNRPKRYGPGSHCFAVYPPSWYERIALVVRSFSPGVDPQGSFDL